MGFLIRWGGVQRRYKKLNNLENNKGLKSNKAYMKHHWKINRIKLKKNCDYIVVTIIIVFFMQASITTIITTITVIKINIVISKNYLSKIKSLLNNMF